MPGSISVPSSQIPSVISLFNLLEISFSGTDVRLIELAISGLGSFWVAGGCGSVRPVARPTDGPQAIRKALDNIKDKTAVRTTVFISPT